MNKREFLLKSAVASQGTSTRDNDKGAWIYVPTGTCEKIVGVRVYKPKG